MRGVAVASVLLASLGSCGDSNRASQPAGRAEQSAAATTSPTPQRSARFVGAPLAVRGSEGRLVVIFRSQRPFVRRSDDGAVIPGTLRIADAQSGRYEGYDGYLGALADGADSGKCYLWTVTQTPRVKAVPVGGPAQYAFRFPDGATESGTTVIGSAPAPSRLERDLRRIGCSPVVGERAQTLRALLGPSS